MSTTRSPHGWSRIETRRIDHVALAVSTALGPVEIAVATAVGAVTVRSGPVRPVRRDGAGRTVGGASALCSVIKLLVARSRPPLGIQETLETDYSFPSGHVTGTAALFGMAAVILGLASRIPGSKGLLAAIAVGSPCRPSRCPGSTSACTGSPTVLARCSAQQR